MVSGLWYQVSEWSCLCGTEDITEAVEGREEARVPEGYLEATKAIAYYTFPRA